MIEPDKIYRPQLTERDYKILKFIGEVDQVSVNILHQKYFPSFTKGTARKFISRMLRGEYIKKTMTILNQGVYTLTYYGVQAVRREFNSQHFMDELKFIRLDHTKHTLDIAEIRSVLEEGNIIEEWESDRLIRRYQSRNFKRKYYPDATFKVGKKLYLLEYERTLKSKPRIKKKIDSIEYAISDLWKEDVDTEAIVVASTPGIKKSYLKANINKRIRVYSLDEVGEIEVGNEQE